MLAVVIWQVLRYREAATRMLWLQQGETALAQRLLGATTPEATGNAATAALAQWLGADVGVLYRLDAEVLWRSGGHAFDPATVPAQIPVPHGAVGQAARDGAVRVVDGASDHLAVDSACAARAAAGDRRAGDGGGRGGRRGRAGLRARDRRRRACPPLRGPGGRAAGHRDARGAVPRAPADAARADADPGRGAAGPTGGTARQQRGARGTGGRCASSQAQLETQQAELEQTNVQLEEHTQSLERQKRELVATRQSLERHGEQLAAASQYKSEFLANMSHELRTPLTAR